MEHIFFIASNRGIDLLVITLTHLDFQITHIEVIPTSSQWSIFEYADDLLDFSLTPNIFKNSDYSEWNFYHL